MFALLGNEPIAEKLGIIGTFQYNPGKRFVIGEDFDVHALSAVMEVVPKAYFSRELRLWQG